mmetsp:Transcript_16298/g.34567  ORF Transcript_16298/g.34567 Transcript_16298/m.34567 type:complete len:202 (-) Transcript_16298:561-1166(-)
MCELSNLVESAKHRVERFDLVLSERRVEERAAHAAVLTERSDRLDRDAVRKFVSIEVFIVVGVGRSEGLLRLCNAHVERLAPTLDEGLPRKHAAAARELVEEVAQRDDRRRDAREQRRVAKRSHLDCGESLWRGGVHRAHRLQEGDLVLLAAALALVHIDARGLVEPFGGGGGTLGRRCALQVGLCCIVQDAADAVLAKFA